MDCLPFVYCSPPNRTCTSSISFDISSHGGDTTQSVLSTFEELKEVRKVHPRKFIVALLNINSLKTKFDEIHVHELLNEKIVDLLFISETKLDSSYRVSLFEISGYKLERRDRDAHGGGLAAFIKSDIPARRRKDLESKSLENITYEVILNKSK